MHPDTPTGTAQLPAGTEIVVRKYRGAPCKFNAVVLSSDAKVVARILTAKGLRFNLSKHDVWDVVEHPATRAARTCEDN